MLLRRWSSQKNESLVTYTYQQHQGYQFQSQSGFPEREKSKWGITENPWAKKKKKPSCNPLEITSWNDPAGIRLPVLQRRGARAHGLM